MTGQAAPVPKRLVWRCTWPEDTTPGPDFLGQEPGYSFAAGRIHRLDTHPSSGPRPWAWTLTGPHLGRREIGETGGLAPSKDEAVQRVVEAWERAKAWCEQTGEPMRWGDGHGGEGVPEGQCPGTGWKAP